MGEGDFFTGILEESADFHGVFIFFTRLFDIPMGEAREVGVLIIIGKFHVQVTGMEFLVDLLIEHFGDFFFDHGCCLLLPK